MDLQNMYTGIQFYFFNNMYYKIALEKWSVHFKKKKISWSTSEIQENQEHT